jgi:predicted unusual protein kinase regulating ubiquinone biosynthesis (AarF/ABC1/UbiB family)
VEAALDDDLANVGTMVKAVGLAANFMESRDYFEEVRRELRAELDYQRELVQLERFARCVAPWPWLTVPRAYPALCTRRVLVLEYFEGPTLHAYCEHVESKPMSERWRITQQLTQAIYGPFLVYGVIHADTHPGNFVVRPNGTLGLLDFGSIKTFSERFRDLYRRALTLALQRRDLDLVALLREGGFTITLDDERARELLDEIADIVIRPIRQRYDFADDVIAEELRRLMMRHATELMRIRPPPESILFHRALAGMAHNMRALKAAGEFKPIFEALLHVEADPAVAETVRGVPGDVKNTP